MNQKVYVKDKYWKTKQTASSSFWMSSSSSLMSCLSASICLVSCSIIVTTLFSFKVYIKWIRRRKFSPTRKQKGFIHSHRLIPKTITSTLHSPSLSPLWQTCFFFFIFFFFFFSLSLLFLFCLILSVSYFLCVSVLLCLSDSQLPIHTHTHKYIHTNTYTGIENQPLSNSNASLTTFPMAAWQICSSFSHCWASSWIALQSYVHPYICIHKC